MCVSMNRCLAALAAAVMVAAAGQSQAEWSFCWLGHLPEDERSFPYAISADGVDATQQGNVSVTAAEPTVEATGIKPDDQTPAGEAAWGEAAQRESIRIGRPARATLQAALGHADPEVANRAKRCLAEIYPVKISPAKSLIAALGGDDGSTWTAAVKALRTLGEPAVEDLVDALEDKDPRVRRGAVQALGKIKVARVIDPLIKMLDDPEATIRTDAAAGLGNLAWHENLRPARLVPAFVAALEDEDPRVRRGAVQALGRIGDRRPLPLLLALADNDEHADVRAAAREALSIIERPQPQLSPIVWGKPLDGLQAGLRCTSGMAPYRYGQIAHYELCVRNVGKRDRMVQWTPFGRGLNHWVKGGEVELGEWSILAGDGVSVLTRKIPAGQVEAVDTIGCTVRPPDWKKDDYPPPIRVAPGGYQVGTTFASILHDPKLKDVWQGGCATGKLPLTVVREEPLEPAATAPEIKVPRPADADKAPADVSITGRVIGIDGKPAVGCGVTALPEAWSTYSGEMPSTTTDERGAFSFRKLPAGPCDVSATSTPLTNQPNMTIEDVVLKKGKPVHVELSLEPKYHFAGRVTDPAGKPQPNRSVLAIWKDPSGKNTYSSYTETNSFGRYNFASPFPTAKSIELNGPNDHRIPKHHDVKHGRDDIDFRREEKPAYVSITGRVISIVGEPARSYHVTALPQAWSTDSGTPPSTITDENGAFIFRGLPDGPCDVSATSTPLTNQPNMTIEDVVLKKGKPVHVELSLEPKYHFAGRVTDTAGKPQTNRLVLVFWKDPSGKNKYSSYTKTDSFGRYNFSSPFEVAERVLANDGVKDTPEHHDVKHGRDDIDFRLKLKAGKHTVRPDADTTGKDEDNRRRVPATSNSVEIEPAKEWEAGAESVREPAEKETTAKRGAKHAEIRLDGRWPDGKIVDGGGTPFGIGEADSTGVELVQGRRGPPSRITVRGKVVDDATGKPVTDFFMQGGKFDPADPTKVVWGYSETRRGRKDGTFSATVRWSEGRTARIVAPDYLPHPVLTLPPSPGQDRMDVVIRLKRGGTIRGRVLDHTGQGVAKAGVYLARQGAVIGLTEDPERSFREAAVHTDAEGRFEIGGRSKDSKAIFVSAPSLFVWRADLPEPGREAIIRLPEPAKLHIRYDIDGGPPAAKVRIELRTSDMPKWKALVDVVRWVDVEAGEGGFIVDNLPPGVYDISRIKHTWAGTRGKGMWLDRQLELKLAPGKTTAHNFLRKTGTPISGEVVGLPEEGVDGVFVSVRDHRASGDPRRLDEWKLRTFDGQALEGNGPFQTERMPPGKYKVVVEAHRQLRRGEVRGMSWPFPEWFATAAVNVPESGEPPKVRLMMHPYDAH